MNRRSFFGVLAAAFGLRLKLDTTPALNFVWTYEKPVLSAADAAFLKSQRLNVEEVARLFHVPVDMITPREGRTYPEAHS